MMGRITRWAVVGVMIVATAACGDPWRGSGVVESKDYDPPYSYYVPGQVISGTESCSGTYPNRSCTRSPDTYIPGHTVYVAPSWTLNVKGDKHMHVVEVPESVWNSCAKGQSFDAASQDCADR